MVSTVEQALSEAIGHHQAGRLGEAERLYRLVIQNAPQQVSALYRLGMLCFQDGRAAQALPFLEEALKLQPQNQGILNSLGAASQIAGHDKEALDYFRRALALDPTHVGALGNFGRALREQGHADAARECFVKIIRIDPDNAGAYVEMGKCSYERGDFPEAVVCFEKALARKPDDTDALSALSGALWAMGRHGEARAKLERALRVAPDDAKVVLNFGEFLAFDEGRMDEALAYFNRALALAPHYDNALWRKSFALLATGDYREGWRLYAECLGGRETRGFNKFAPQEPWDGAADPNKHLLIWCEQGLGDSLHFIRYAALCKERVGKVSVFCQKPLVRLFKALPYVDDAAATCESGSFDEHVPIMNLPHLFDTVVENVPAAPYLRVDAGIAAKWAKKFVGVGNELKVGLVWAGGAHENKVNARITDLQRSIGLERMRPWLGLEGVKFYSLQKDKPAEQIAALGLEDRLIDFMGEVADFADTAAIVQNLDLVITVDTAVAHLAGGLGKTVWIMSRYSADWRWLQNRPESPWYPSARIFGQKEMGDWDSVMAEVERALVIEIAKRGLAQDDYR